jgi:endo-alpha-1,4-polygalactosaminidase (GH114 family)
MRTLHGRPWLTLLMMILVFGFGACIPNEIKTTGGMKEKAPMSEEPSSTSSKEWWRPVNGLTWQWQPTGDPDLNLQTDVVDIDLDVSPSVVDHFHNQGTKVICYISVGSYENWRSDAAQFPDEVLGKDYEGWPGEKWLDIRRIDLLAPIMLARLDKCVAKGFDGVEPDNMQIWDNDTGFPLTYADQLHYALWLAQEAHKRGLAIGQKNAPDQTGDLVDVFDFAITEDAFYYGWAKEMLPYIQAGKPVFAAEYTDLPGDFQEFCRQSKELGFSTILKHRDLVAWLETCP